VSRIGVITTIVDTGCRKTTEPVPKNAMGTAVLGTGSRNGCQFWLLVVGDGAGGASMEGLGMRVEPYQNSGDATIGELCDDCV